MAKSYRPRGKRAVNSSPTPAKKTSSESREPVAIVQVMT
jgi:hypothetical protein